MNDFDAIFVQVAVEKKMLNPSQARRAQELIEGTKGAGSTGELLVKNGLLNSMQVKDILRVQMERLKTGGAPTNPKPVEPPRDEGPSMTLMVNAADLFGASANAAPSQPTPGPRAPAAPNRPQEDPGSQTLALNFNEIMNAQAAPAAPAKPAQPDPGSQTLALNAVDLFGAQMPEPARPAAPAAPAARPTPPAAAPKPPAAAKPVAPPHRPAPPMPADPSPMQTLALNAADLFGGNVSQAGAKLSSVRNEPGPAPVTAPARPPAQPPAHQPDVGTQTLSLDAADLFGGHVVASDGSTSPGTVNTTRPQSAAAGRQASGSGSTNAVPTGGQNRQPAPAPAPAHPAPPKADALNAFDIFGLPAEAPPAHPAPVANSPMAAADAAAAAEKKARGDEAEGGYTLQLNAADLFGSASEAPKPVQRAPDVGSSTTQSTQPAAGTPGQPAIEPPMPGREPKPGQVYGNTKLIKRLGEGNMAIVFQGETLDTHQTLALKFLKPEVGANTTSVKRFVREAESAQKIKHPNVLETYRVSEYRGWHYMEMELMVGEDIRALMKRGTVPLAQALKLCLAAAAGLQAAHEQGVIHRDIKPENLMIMSNGALKIADFGLARVQEAAGLTMPGQMLGTPAYMAPEQWEGKPPDARTDIYALGVTLFDMITGRRPIEGTTAGAIIQTLFGKGPTPIEQVNPALPKSVVDLVNQMVKVNADDRPGTMAEVRKRMEASLAEIAGAPDAEQLKKDSALGATMVTDEAGQAQLQAELKALKVGKDKGSDAPRTGTKNVKPVTKSAEDEATMKMAPGELEKVLSKAPTADEKKEAASRDEATLAMTAEDVEAMKRGLAETELKKDAVKTKTDDGGIMRVVLIVAIVLVVLLIVVVGAVVLYFVFKDPEPTGALPFHPARLLADLLPALL